MRSFFRWISTTLLHVSVFLLIAAFSFVFLVSDSRVLKDTLVDTQVYTDFVPAVIDENLQQADTQQNVLPLDHLGVQAVVNNAFSPRLLQTQTEAVIDDVYSWLDGTTSELSFAYDFSESKNAMIQGIATFAANRVLSLPECETALGEINVFDVACQPPGFTHELIRSQVLSDLESTTFWEDTSITQDNLPKGDDGQTVQQRFSYIPTAYKIMSNAIFPAIALFIVSAILFVLLRKPFNKGFRALGRDLLSNGLMIVLLTVVFGFILPQYTNVFSVEGTGTTQLMNRVVDSFIKSFDIIVINVAIQIAAAGFALLLMVKINTRSGGYKDLDVRTGLTSSRISKSSPSKPTDEKRPPVQTSELSKKRPKKSLSKKSAKYRKMGL